MLATGAALLAGGVSRSSSSLLAEIVADTLRFWFALAYLLLVSILSSVRTSAYNRSVWLEERRRARAAARRGGSGGGDGGGNAAPCGAAPPIRVPRPSDVSAALRHDDEAVAHVYGLYVHLRDWNAPHYRAPSFGQDIRDNLRNVAAPGTGLPLSWLCWPVNGGGGGGGGTTASPSPSAPPALFSSVLSALPPFLPTFAAFFLLPPACLASALRLHAHQGGGVAQWYRRQLLAPRCWFAVWRCNSALAALHARVAGAADPRVQKQYRLEGKGRFLRAALAKGLPVAPALSSPARLVAKHVNVEGGLGIHVFDNVLAVNRRRRGKGRAGGSGGNGGNGGGNGGDQEDDAWILQPWLDNARDVARLLPEGAPLSTLRIVTCSSRWLDRAAAGGGGGGSSLSSSPSASPLPSRRASDEGGAPADGGPSPAGPAVAGGGGSSAARALAAAASPLRAFLGGGRGGAAAAAANDDVAAARGDQGSDEDGAPAELPPLGDGKVPALAAAIEARGPRPVLPPPPPSPGDVAAAASPPALLSPPRRAPNPPSPSPVLPPAPTQDNNENNAAASSSADSAPHLASPDGSVHVVTAVWRAGFAGASTDHSAVCFGVDVSTGKLVPGTSAAHWYRLGLRHAFFGRWLPFGRWLGGGGGNKPDPTAGSPDGARWSYVPQTGLVVSGRVFPGWEDACRAAVKAHRELLRDVPLVGWDVALVDGDGEGATATTRKKKNQPLLLEANLSLNFFGGACDRAAYASFMIDAFAALAECEERTGGG